MNTTENNIRETNVLIAEFMDINKLSSNVLKKALLSDLDYHLSWDWLMPVVEKINDLHVQGAPEIRIGKYMTEVFYSPIINGEEKNLMSTFRILNEVKKIDTVYFSCISFIKWYNENSAKKD